MRARYVYEDYLRHGEVRRARRMPNAEEAARRTQLEAELESLHARMEALSDEDGGEDEYAALEAEEERLQGELNALDEALAVFPAELMAQAGCVVYVGRNGAVEVKRGLVRPEDREALVQASRQSVIREPSQALRWSACPRVAPAPRTPKS